MPTTAGVVYIVAATVLFCFWIYGLVSFYFDLRYRYLPLLRSWLNSRADDRHLM